MDITALPWMEFKQRQRRKRPQGWIIGRSDNWCLKKKDRKELVKETWNHEEYVKLELQRRCLFYEHVAQQVAFSNKWLVGSSNPRPPPCLLLCPWERNFTPNFCGWMKVECEEFCGAVRVASKELNTCSLFTITPHRNDMNLNTCPISAPQTHS